MQEGSNLTSGHHLKRTRNRRTAGEPTLPVADRHTDSAYRTATRLSQPGRVGGRLAPLC